MKRKTVALTTMITGLVGTMGCHRVHRHAG